MDCQDETKVCTKCHETKPLIDFYVGKGRGGRAARCVVCTRDYMRDWHRGRAAERAERGDPAPVTWCLSLDDALHQLAAACRRWSECEDYEERAGARDAAVYRARQLVAAVGGEA